MTTCDCLAHRFPSGQFIDQETGRELGFGLEAADMDERLAALYPGHPPGIGRRAYLKDGSFDGSIAHDEPVRLQGYGDCLVEHPHAYHVSQKRLS